MHYIQTMKEKRYLLTGATGHLGKKLLQLLLEQKASVRVLVLKHEVPLLPEGIDYVIGDITRLNTLYPFFRRTGAPHPPPVLFRTVYSKYTSSPPFPLLFFCLRYFL